MHLISNAARKELVAILHNTVLRQKSEMAVLLDRLSVHSGSIGIDFSAARRKKRAPEKTCAELEAVLDKLISRLSSVISTGIVSKMKTKRRNE
jgi:hypothetical protein